MCHSNIFKTILFITVIRRVSIRIYRMWCDSRWIFHRMNFPKLKFLNRQTRVITNTCQTDYNWISVVLLSLAANERTCSVILLIASFSESFEKFGQFVILVSRQTDFFMRAHFINKKNFGFLVETVCSWKDKSFVS